MKHRLWDERDVQAMTSTDVANEHNRLYEEWEAASNEVASTKKWNAECNAENIHLRDRIHKFGERESQIMDENNRLDREPDEFRQQAKANASHDEFWTVGNIMALGAREVVKRHEEDMKAARQPVTDAMIEKMAEAAFREMHKTSNWSTADHEWYCNAIRAALAAIGPQYCPSDVGFASRVPELEKKIDNQRMSLRELHHARQLEAGERLRLEQDLKNERDKANRFDATAQELSKIIDDQKRDKDSLRSALARVTSERDEIETKLMSETMRRQELEGYLADSAMAVIDAPAGEPTPEQVEALAIELCDTAPVTAPWKFTEWKDEWRTIARAAFAHIQQTARPKGLPTNEDVARVLRECNSMTTDARAEAILAALAPYLREPTGWTMPVTAKEAAMAFQHARYDGDADWQAVIDLCRSRIRPTFECKECAKKEAELRRHNDKWSGFIQRCQSDAQNARAALEGE